jgi:mono/diheme cytochrome c family protein
MFGLVAMTVLWAVPTLAQDADLIAAGKQEFRHYCAVCHGIGGKGESVMTTFNLLKVRPTDLTQLRKRNKGQFPFWHVYRVIDGREAVRGHGDRDMPIWGDVFIRQEDKGLADDARAIGRILQLVYYLQSIQEK